MNPRRPRWILLSLMFGIGFLLRELPNWLRAWQASGSGKPAAHRKRSTRWPSTRPPAPRARPAAQRAPRRKANKKRER